MNISDILFSAIDVCTHVWRHYDENRCANCDGFVRDTLIYELRSTI